MKYYRPEIIAEDDDLISPEVLEQMNKDYELDFNGFEDTSEDLFGYNIFNEDEIPMYMIYTNEPKIVGFTLSEELAKKSCKENKEFNYKVIGINHTEIKR